MDVVILMRTEKCLAQVRGNFEHGAFFILVAVQKKMRFNLASVKTEWGQVRFDYQTSPVT